MARLPADQRRQRRARSFAVGAGDGERDRPGNRGSGSASRRFLQSKPLGHAAHAIETEIDAAWMELLLPGQPVGQSPTAGFQAALWCVSIASRRWIFSRI